MSDEYAKVIIHKSDPDNSGHYHKVWAEWEGDSNRTLISDELLEQGDPALMMRNGDELKLCGLSLRIVGPHPNWPNTTVLERV